MRSALARRSPPGSMLIGPLFIELFALVTYSSRISRTTSDGLRTRVLRPGRPVVVHMWDEVLR